MATFQVYITLITKVLSSAPSDKHHAMDVTAFYFLYRYKRFICVLYVKKNQNMLNTMLWQHFLFLYRYKRFIRVLYVLYVKKNRNVLNTIQ
jgi:hypothetical protein